MYISKFFKFPRFYANYWTCTDFADWLRGTPKPKTGLTLEGWENWYLMAKQKHPIRYYIAEIGLKKLQNFVNYPSDLTKNIKNKLKNKLIDKYYCLTSHNLDPYEYYDLDTRILYTVFDEFINFVEIEAAYQMTFKNKGKYTFINNRCPEAGLDWLKYQSEDPLNLERGAKWLTLIELYHWWKKRIKLDDYNQNQHETDTEQLVSLVKLRGFLWT